MKTSRRILRTLFGWCAVNLFVVVPTLVALTIFTPDCLRIDGVSESAVDLHVGNVGNWNTTAPEDIHYNMVSGFVKQNDGSRSARLYFADGCPIDKLALKFVGQKLSLEVTDVCLIKHTLFKSRLSVLEFIKAYAPTGAASVTKKDGHVIICADETNSCEFVRDLNYIPSWGGWTLTLGEIDKKWFPRVWCFELLLLIGALVFTFYNDDATKKQITGLSAIVGTGVALFCGAIVPLQTYFTNRDLYEFPISAVVSDALVWAVVLFFVAFLSLTILGTLFGRWPHVITMSFLVYEYLLVGPLMKGAPLLNGGVAFFGTPELVHRDFCVMALVLVFFVCAFHWVKKWLHFFVLGFLAMCLSMIVDASLKKVPCEGKPHSDVPSRMDVAKSIFHSSHRNVFVFCLDATRGDVSLKVMKENPELTNLYKGFTAFSNNIGMYPATIYGMPGFCMGRYAKDNESASDFMDGILGSESFIAAYLTNNIPVWSLMGSAKHSFSNMDVLHKGDDLDAKDSNQSYQSSLFRRPDAIPPLNIFEVTRFKMIPFWYKSSMLQTTALRASAMQNIKRETTLFPYVESAPVKDDFLMTLQCYHTYGTHSPVNIDKDGNYLSEPQNSSQALEDMNYHVLKRTGELMGVLRDRGLYDNSFIVILADHGNDNSNHSVFGKHDIPGSAIPMLWVKPVAATNEFSISDIATSHQKIHDMMVASVNRNLSIQEIEQILEQKLRKYVDQKSYYTTGNVLYIDDRGAIVKNSNE